eukprot:1717897-Pyramimonas_sp.AAC.1
MAARADGTTTPTFQCGGMATGEVRGHPGREPARRLLDHDGARPNMDLMAGGRPGDDLRRAGRRALFEAAREDRELLDAACRATRGTVPGGGDERSPALSEDERTAAGGGHRTHRAGGAESLRPHPRQARLPGHELGPSAGGCHSLDARNGYGKNGHNAQQQ